MIDLAPPADPVHGAVGKPWSGWGAAGVSRGGRRHPRVVGPDAVETVHRLWITTWPPTSAYTPWSTIHTPYYCNCQN